MKKVLGCFVLLCSAAFAQDTSTNAAAGALKKRLDQLKLVNPPKPVITLPAAPVAGAAPKICSIPLLNVRPVVPGTPNANVDKMPVVKPGLPGNTGDFAKIPAPPCEIGLIQLPQ